MPSAGLQRTAACSPYDHSFRSNRQAGILQDRLAIIRLKTLVDKAFRRDLAGVNLRDLDAENDSDGPVDVTPRIDWILLHRTSLIFLEGGARYERLDVGLLIQGAISRRRFTGRIGRDSRELN